MTQTVRERVQAIRDECEGVWGVSGITSWERDFLDSIEDRIKLSERQEEVLCEIEAKAFRRD